MVNVVPTVSLSDVHWWCVSGAHHLHNVSVEHNKPSCDVHVLDVTGTCYHSQGHHRTYSYVGMHLTLPLSPTPHTTSGEREQYNCPLS